MRASASVVRTNEAQNRLHLFYGFLKQVNYGRVEQHRQFVRSWQSMLLPLIRLQKNMSFEEHAAALPCDEADSRETFAIISSALPNSSFSAGYSFLVPLTVLAWKRLGIQSFVIFVGRYRIIVTKPQRFTWR